jgi:hypothetical protein
LECAEVDDFWMATLMSEERRRERRRRRREGGRAATPKTQRCSSFEARAWGRMKSARQRQSTSELQAIASHCARGWRRERGVEATSAVHLLFLLRV